MFNKIAAAMASRFGVVLLGWIASACLIALSSMLVLGKASIDDNAKAMDAYRETNSALSDDIKDIKKLVVEIRKASFDSAAAMLTKQVYKLANDPDDIKSIDMVAASNFCTTKIYSDHYDELSGSNKVLMSRSCSVVNNWIELNQT